MLLLPPGNGYKLIPSRLDALRQFEPNLRSAYMLYWIPLEEDIWLKFLVNDSAIVSLHFADYTNKYIAPDTRLVDSYKNLLETKVITLAAYRKGLKQQNQIQLAVALDLASIECAGEKS